MSSRTLKASILTVGQGLVAVTNILLFSILSRLFSKEDYAIYQQSVLAYRFISPILLLGLPNALYYFIPKNNKDSRQVLLTNYLLLFITGSVFCAFLWFGGNKIISDLFSNKPLERALLILSYYGFAALPLMSITPALVSFDKIKLASIFNIVSKVGIILIVLFFVFFIDRSPFTAIYGLVVGSFIVLIPGIWLLYKFSFGRLTLKLNHVTEQLKYSIPVGLAGMIGLISLNIDKFIVSSMTSPEIFATYVNGAIEIPLVSVITGSAMSVLIPEFSLLIQKKQIDKILTIWHNSILKISLFIFPVAAFLLVHAKDVVIVLFSAKYVDSYVPFSIYLLILPARIVIWSSIFLSAGRSDYVFKQTLITFLVKLPVLWFIVKFVNPLYAAMSTVIALYLFNIPISIYFTRKILKVSLKALVPYKKILIIGSVNYLVALFIQPGFLLKIDECFGRLVLNGAVFLLVIFFLYVKVPFINSYLVSMLGGRRIPFILK